MEEHIKYYPLKCLFISKLLQIINSYSITNFMKYIIIFLWFLFNLNYAYSDTISYETVAESEILPQNAIYKVDNDFYFSIKIDLKDGWKTYWKNPGDAGLPIEINWGENSKKVDHEILFPFPQKYLSNDVLTIGYENEVVFIVKIKLNDLTDNIKQKLKLNYLVCEDICIPISEEKTIDLNFKNIKNSSDFINSYNKIPKKINYEDIAEKKILSPKKVRLFVKPNLEFSNDKIFIFSEESNLTLENFERNTGILDILSDKLINQLTKSILISYETKNDFEEVVIKLDDLKPKKSLFYFCILAFFGGLILNFMPCVLPVLSLKILSFSSLIEKKKKKLIRLSSLNITFGIISSFLILGLLVVLFKYFGTLKLGGVFTFKIKFL